MDIEYETSGGQRMGYLALPTADGSAPGVLVLHGGGGIGPHAKQRADMLAAMGYVAFVPDLFGHSPSFVVDAVAQQLRSGYEVGPMSPLAGEVAQLICEMTGMERASFVFGSEGLAASALKPAPAKNWSK